MNSKASHSELCEYALRINEQIQIKAAASMLLDGDRVEEEYESQDEFLASDEDSDGEDGFDASESDEAVTVSLLSLYKVIKQPTPSKLRTENPTGTPRLRKHFPQLEVILVPTTSVNAKKGGQTQPSTTCSFSQLSHSSERPGCETGGFQTTSIW
jgi:hypothetical protein